MNLKVTILKINIINKMAMVEKAGLLSSDEAYKIVAPVVIELFDEKVLDPRVNENVAEKLGFTDYEVVDKDGQIQTKLGLKGAQLVGEFDAFKINGKKYGNKISYELVRTHIGSGMSSKTKVWLDRASQAQGIPTDLLKDLKGAMNDMEDQAYEIAITQNEYITKCLTDWFSISSNFWPGSAVYDGKALFATDHIIIGTGWTFSNIVDDGAGNYAALSYTSLKAAVKKLREMKDGLGVRVRRPMSGIYDLVVSPELEETALDVLSDGNGFQPYDYSGSAATNDNYSNVFMTRAWFKVRLVVLETLNQPDSQNEGSNIGSATVWFVVNKETAQLRKALRKLNFGDISIKLYEDDETRATFLTAEKFFGAQPLYPEIIVGSTGTGSAI